MVKTNLSTEHLTASVYKRKIADPQYPLHMVCFYFRNFMYQIALTLDQASFGQSTNWSFIPAHYVAKTAESDEPFVLNRTVVDQNSPEEFHPEKETITLMPDKEAMKKLVSVLLPPDFLEKFKKWNG